MKHIAKYLLIVVLLSTSFLLIANFNSKKNNVKREVVTLVRSFKIQQAKTFCEKNHLDTKYAVFIDMSVHPGRKRFLVVNLQTEKILFKSLCCHGMGKKSTEEKPEYSNEVGSNCTSLGKYKTGIRSYSQWGINIHYKLHGLEKTNSNAFKRTVVMHSYDPVSESEIYPEYLPMGWSLGCPVISNNTMTRMDSLLKKRQMPMLVWIYQ
jgi:hypothetical protein